MKKLNKILLYFLFLLCILVIIGLLNFGHGLADIVLIAPVILLALIHLSLTMYLSKKRNDRFWLPMVIFSAITCIYIIYKSTIGRVPNFLGMEIYFL